MKKLFYFILVLIMSACSVETTTNESTTSGTSDGTASAPAELTVGTAKSGGVAYMGDSYYKFTTSSTGAGSYKLAIDSMVTDEGSSYGVTTYLFSNSGLTTSSRIDSEWCAASCTIYFDYENLDSSKTYYLHLSAWGTITYSLTLSQSGSEGSVTNPVELTLGTAHSGTIDNIDSSSWENGYSYYKFTTVSADNYTLTMTNSDSLDCTLYSNSAFSTQVSYLTNLNCTAGTNLSENFTGTSSSAGLSASTAYYLRIEGVSTTLKTTTYDITVAAEGN